MRNDFVVNSKFLIPNFKLQFPASSLSSDFFY